MEQIQSLKDPRIQKARFLNQTKNRIKTGKLLIPVVAVGTIVRTAGAFEINTILSTQPDTDLFNRKKVAASRGKHMI